MANETPNSHNEFIEFTNGVSAASTVFTKSIYDLNKVYLEFCDHLLESASNTAKDIIGLKKEVSGLKNTLNTATEKVKKDSLKAADKTTTELEHVTKVSSGNNNNSYVAPYQALSEQLLDDLKMMTGNFIHAQNQMYIAATAATNMGIMKIYDGTKSTETKGNKSALKVSNSKK